MYILADNKKCSYFDMAQTLEIHKTFFKHFLMTTWQRGNN